MKTEKMLFVEDGRVNGEVQFQKGKIYDIPVETGSVQRWLKRGVAVVVDQAPGEEPVEASPVEVEVVEQAAAAGQEVVEEAIADLHQEVAKPKTRKENKKNAALKGL